MVSIRGVGGVPEPTPERPADVRDRKRNETPDIPLQDGVQISSKAQAAAEAARLAEIAKAEPDVRADRVAAAKERIERGEYKREDVVARVAEQLSRYVPD